LKMHAIPTMAALLFSISLISAVKSSELQSLVIVTRAGASVPRDPLFSSPQLPTYTSAEGTLTDAGRRQSYLLGASLRQKYLENSQMFPTIMTKRDYITTKSTNSSDTIETSQNFMLGLLSLQASLTLTERQTVTSIPQFNVRNLTNLLENLGNWPLLEGYLPISVENSLKFACEVNGSFDLGLDLLEAVQESFGGVLGELDIDGPKISRELLAAWVQGLDIPGGEQLIANVRRVMAYYLYNDLFGDVEVAKAVARPLVSDLAEYLEKVDAGSNKDKVVHYVVGETEMAALLKVIGVSTYPDYAANLVFAISDQDDNLQFETEFNGTQIGIDGCTSNCGLEALIDYLRQQIQEDDWENHCD